MSPISACMVATLLMALVLVTAPLRVSGTITCTQMEEDLAPCLNYLQNGGVVPPSCCSGIKTLVSAAQTKTDRQAACVCIKTALAEIPGLKLDLASSLPSKCGVNVPFKISPSTDCSK